MFPVRRPCAAPVRPLRISPTGASIAIEDRSNHGPNHPPIVRIEPGFCRRSASLAPSAYCLHLHQHFQPRGVGGKCASGPSKSAPHVSRQFSSPRSFDRIARSRILHPLSRCASHPRDSGPASSPLFSAPLVSLALQPSVCPAYPRAALDRVVFLCFPVHSALFWLQRAGPPLRVVSNRSPAVDCCPLFAPRTLHAPACAARARAHSIVRSARSRGRAGARARRCAYTRARFIYI